MREEQYLLVENEASRLTISATRVTVKVAKKHKDIKSLIEYASRVIMNEPEMLEPIHTMRGHFEITENEIAIIMKDDSNKTQFRYEFEK